MDEGCRAQSEEAQIVAIRAVVFDVGGVLEITPDLGVDRLWEARLGLTAGEMGDRMGDVWTGGSLGTLTLEEVHQAIRDRLDLDEQQLAAYMADLWREYLTSANTELFHGATGSALDLRGCRSCGRCHHLSKQGVNRN